MTFYTQVLHIKNNFAWLGWSFINSEFYITANHHAAELFLAGIGNFNCTDVAALTENRTTVRNFHNFVELVGNEKN